MKHSDGLSQDEALLQRLTQIVLDNLNNEQFGVVELSEQIGISRSHLFYSVHIRHYGLALSHTLQNPLL